MHDPRERGFSIGEMLVVIALIGITVALAIPLVNEQVRVANIRGAADQMATHLRAARMIAVSHRKDITVTVNIDPTNSYSYENTTGTMMTYSMPSQVVIKSGSSTSITFHSDGSAAAASTVTAESTVANAIERWTLSVNALGLVSVAHVRV
jgi:prepilin-type N-terminal cleavage/methylation domain-containing protein